MIELFLLLALVAFVISVALLLKSRMRRGPGNNLLLLFMAAAAFTFMISCGGDKPNEDADGKGQDTDTILSTDNYTVYITKEDIDSIEKSDEDTMMVSMTRREYSGMQLFMTNCNGCHPGGMQGKGPSLIDKPLPDFLIHFQIRQGMGDMPAFKEEELSKDEVKRIVLFVRSMREDYKATHN
jgi:hypothetical protein